MIQIWTAFAEGYCKIATFKDHQHRPRNLDLSTTPSREHYRGRLSALHHLIVIGEHQVLTCFDFLFGHYALSRHDGSENDQESDATGEEEGTEEDAAGQSCPASD